MLPLPSAASATAEWEFVQNTHWLKRDTTAANVSRSPTVQSAMVRA